METLSRKKLGYLHANGRREFISNALKLYCLEKNIKIGYAIPYMHEENGMAKRYWKILAIIKDILLIDSSFSFNF